MATPCSEKKGFRSHCLSGRAWNAYCSNHQVICYRKPWEKWNGKQTEGRSSDVLQEHGSSGFFICFCFHRVSLMNRCTKPSLIHHSIFLNTKVCIVSDEQRMILEPASILPDLLCGKDERSMLAFSNRKVWPASDHMIISQKCSSRRI